MARVLDIILSYGCKATDPGRDERPRKYVIKTSEGYISDKYTITDKLREARRVPSFQRAAKCARPFKGLIYGEFEVLQIVFFGLCTKTTGVKV